MQQGLVSSRLGIFGVLVSFFFFFVALILPRVDAAFPRLHYTKQAVLLMDLIPII